MSKKCHFTGKKVSLGNQKTYWKCSPIWASTGTQSGSDGRAIVSQSVNGSTEGGQLILFVMLPSQGRQHS